MKLFFGGSKPKATPKDAIITLRENLSMLEKRESHLQAKVENELRLARTNATKNKQAALAALKRKRLLESQIDKISGSRMTLETQVMAIEAANVNLETMKAMQKGAEAMKGIHKDLDIDKVDQTMDDIREQMDLANEVSEAISQPQMFGADLDEDELNAELEELEQEELDKQLLNAERAPVSLPKVPSAAVRQPGRVPAAVASFIDEDEDDELAELRESMGMAA
ncbi:Snf7-domain-containing protein [Kickxella alabastrina]|uniref:Snf7-domain-containing protein n=1 Tax=Kickxella alabastrina TaxID=61397 RepID=UPI0022208F4B|nr:Snf7-domain-containing protein [Kickxella alabastrina]KAI7832888.1 Snf7-domain-containing protein [Kickxella alabastrina]